MASKKLRGTVLTIFSWITIFLEYMIFVVMQGRIGTISAMGHTVVTSAIMGTTIVGCLTARMSKNRVSFAFNLIVGFWTSILWEVAYNCYMGRMAL